jgi:AcrR family transcriptional regulator
MSSEARPTYPTAAKALLRETLLDAADALLDERAWAKISMGEVARRAGVSRQTLYNEFGGRREFAEAFVLREADRLMAGPELQIANHPDDPRAAIEGAMRTFLEAATRNRLLQSMVSEPEDGLLALVTTRDAVLVAATERLAPLIGRTWPGVDARAVRQLTETVVRLAISHATLPTAAPAATARAVTEVLGPHLDELVSTQHSRAA